jgi:hypothetical protein
MYIHIPVYGNLFSTIMRYRYVHIPMYDCPIATRMIQIQIEWLLMVCSQ